MNRLIGVSLIIIFSSVTAVIAEPVDVLVLHSYYSDLPWTKGFREGLHDAQIEHPELRYHTEYLDASRIGESLTHQQWAGYLKLKYQSVKIDVIIGDSGPAAALIYAYPELFGPVPQVIYSPVPHVTKRYQLSLNPQIQAAVAETTRIAVEQNPEADEAIVINGGNPATRSTLEYLYAVLEEYNVEVQEVSDFTLGELQNLLQTCDSDSIVFYTLVFSDRSGERFVPRKVLEELSEVSVAPIYTFWGTLAGSGIIGGTMIDARVAAYEAMKAGVNYLERRSFGDAYGTTQTYMDWSALKRYGVNPRRIPAGTVILNKPDPFFIKYYKETVTVVSFLFLIGFIIMVVLFQRNLAINRRLTIQGAKLRDALSEKTILYKEMNNRIKNNLSILSSMISLQISEIEDEASREQLRNAAGRLRTLALVHEELSSDQYTTRIYIREYLRSLVLQVFDAISSEPAEEHLRIDIDEIGVENKNAVACGLIVHELLTNALRFAFPGYSLGTIHVTLRKLSDHNAELTVADSGIGIPPGFRLESDAKLGLKIVQSLVKQLNGSIEIRNADGAVFDIRFDI